MKHGTRYAYAKLKCRCDECAELMRTYQREYAQRRRAQGLSPDDHRHGTTAGYDQFNCRCDPCRAADRSKRGKGGPPRGTRLGRNTYLGMHADLKKRRGAAANYRCPCGQQAQEWALKPSVEPRTDPDGRKFSGHLDDYQPMCVPCHRKMDLRKEQCPKGHPYSDANLLVDRNGYRMCRECRRSRQLVANLSPERLELTRLRKREVERQRRLARKSA